jgi:hypothetical protein
MQKSEICREPIEWCDIWVRGCTGTDLPRVLMIGDSITKSYFKFVDKTLKGRFSCGQLATSKCVGDPALLKEFDMVFCDNAFHIIHFNNGMHGWDYTEEQYARGLKETFDWLLKHSPKSRLIWAHTTPVRKGEKFFEINVETTNRVMERNRIATRLATERNLPINDLFALVLDHPEWFSDGVHFHPEGQEALARQVIDIIDV